LRFFHPVPPLRKQGGSVLETLEKSVDQGQTSRI
jgi:hypothetical protein